MDLKYTVYWLLLFVLTIAQHSRHSQLQIATQKVSGSLLKLVWPWQSWAPACFPNFSCFDIKATQSFYNKVKQLLNWSTQIEFGLHVWTGVWQFQSYGKPTSSNTRKINLIWLKFYEIKIKLFYPQNISYKRGNFGNTLFLQWWRLRLQNALKGSWTGVGV